MIGCAGEETVGIPWHRGDAGDMSEKCEPTGTTKFSGGCLCGSVRYSVESEIVARRRCWCRDCQYLACGNGSINLIVATLGVDVTGHLASHRSSADSGNHIIRAFCPTCGTQLFASDAERADYMVIRVGTLDHPEIGAPNTTIWTASAPEWAAPDGCTENFERQPLLSEVLASSERSKSADDQVA